MQTKRPGKCGEGKRLRLTSREKEIFEVLKKEPLISQEDLAHRFGITRSSAAVHISNLMKKGVILGKGYVFNEQATIVVAGDIYVAVEVQEDHRTIDIRQSGSAFELSSVFARFGVTPKVVAVLGHDELGTNILQRMQKMNIDTSNIVRLTNVRTCRRVYMNQRLLYEEGFQPADMQRAFESREWVTFNCEYLVVDPSYQEIIYRRSMSKEEDKLPQLCTYGYPADVRDMPEYLRRYSVVVLGVQSHHVFDACMAKCLEYINADQQVFILTDGRQRLTYLNSWGVHDFPLLPGQEFDSESALPRLLAGAVYGLSNHYPLRQAVRIGIGAASAETSMGESVNT